MGIGKIICFLLLLCGSAQAFVYSCEEVQHKLVNSTIEVNAQYICLVPSISLVKYQFAFFESVYAESGDFSTSFVDLIDRTCIERPGNAPWRITSDFPDVDFDCAHYSKLTLIFTSTIPDIEIIPDYNVIQTRVIRSGEEPFFVFPYAGIYIHPQKCTGNGNVTVFTGAGKGEDEKRFFMRSWPCPDLPDWILAMDNVITITVDSGAELTIQYESQDTFYHMQLTPLEQRITVMGSGRSDDWIMSSPSFNYFSFEAWKEPSSDKLRVINVTVACSPCLFDPKYESYIRLTAFVNEPMQTGGQWEFYNEFDASYLFNYEFYIEFMSNAIAPEDVGESNDYFVVDLTFSVDEPHTTPRPGTKTDAPALTTPISVKTTQKPVQHGDPYCRCELDAKFGMPFGWESTEIWIDVVIILDTSEAMGEVSLVDASTLIESFIGPSDEDVLTTDSNAKFYTRIGLIAMSDKAEVLYNLNMTKSDKVSGEVHVKKGVTVINVVDAFNAAITMFNDGLKTDPERVNTRKVIYYMTDSDPKADLRALNEFKTSQGIIIVNNFIENGDIERPGLKDLASDGYYSSDIQDNYMATIQLFCKANCFCRPDLDRTAYAGQSTDPAVKASGGCFHAAPVGVQFSKAKANCGNLGGGLVASIHDQNKAEFVQKLMAKAAPKSDYFWIGYTKTDAAWSWEDESTNSYTNWDVQNGEPSSAAVSKCAYMDTTTPGLYWGAGNCNIGFPAVCEFAPCSVGNDNC